MAGIKTFGEFFAVVVKWAEENKNHEAQGFLNQWKGMASEEYWKEVEAMPFDRDLYLNFSEDMATFYRERIAGICTKGLYSLFMESGHSFLQAIYTIGKESGMDIGIEKIDVPLSISDAIRMAQMRG